MNIVKSFNYKPFVAPPNVTVLKPKSLLVWGLNVITLGAYGSAEALSKCHCIKELKLIHEDLKHQAATLLNECDALEADLVNIVEEWKSLTDSEKKVFKLKDKMEEVTSQKDNLQSDNIKASHISTTTISDVAIGIISYIGQLFLNIISVGLYGVLQNNYLQNQINVLEAHNTFIQDQFSEQKDCKLNGLEKIIEIANDYIVEQEEGSSAKQSLNGIKNTDPAKAYLAEQQAKKDLADLQKKFQTLQTDYTAIKTEKTKAEQELTDLYAGMIGMQDDAVGIKNEKEQREKEIKDLKVAEQKKTKEMTDLQNQLKAAQVKVGQITDLQKEVTDLKSKQIANADQVKKLLPQVGAIAPKYTATANDKVVHGAMDIRVTGTEEGEFTDEEMDKYKKSLPKDKLKFFEEYNTRYADANLASTVVADGFNHAVHALLDMVPDGKIKLNNSGMTIKTLGAQAIYRYMVLDLLNGGKVMQGNDCHGFKLRINENVSMLPSKSENVLQYKTNPQGGKDPFITFHYLQKDDFTPSEGVLKLRDGVDPVGAKWILEQLTKAESDYLFTYLMEPIIENTHPDHIAMKAFMKNKNDPRVKLVQTAYELIIDMATATRLKFETNACAETWSENFDNWDDAVKPFQKAEELDAEAAAKVDDIIQVDGSKVVNWELDPDIVGDKRDGDKKARQPEFFDIVNAAKANFQQVFNAFGKVNIMLAPEKANQKFKKISMTQINKHFHVSHQMIGATAAGGWAGGERCLFSNLLAILVGNSAFLTSENVNKLKKAMANYLDTLQAASSKWATESLKPANLQSKDVMSLKEKAALFKQFESGIKSTHNCTVDAYQRWLRNDSTGAATINASNLTSFEIQLAAFALGIRIGLVSIDTDGAIMTDDHGRIVPENEYYGPNTEEFLLMGISDPSKTGGTYYGLNPRLDESQPDLLSNLSLCQVVADVESYWMNIDMNKKNP